MDNPLHRVNSPFNAPRKYPGNHEGIDLFARSGDPINASKSGVVIWSSNQRRSGGDSKYGEHIIIDHDDEYITWYAHLSSRLARRGDVVVQGQTIGLAGDTGNADGVHLHLNIQCIGCGLGGYIVNDVVDPAPILGLT